MSGCNYSALLDVTADIIGVDEKLFAKANNSSVEMSAGRVTGFLKRWKMQNMIYI